MILFCEIITHIMQISYTRDKGETVKLNIKRNTVNLIGMCKDIERQCFQNAGNVFLYFLY